MRSATVALSLVSLAGAVGQAPPFVATAATAVAPTSLSLSPDLRVVLQGGQVIVEGGGAARALPCTSPDSTGRAFAFTRHPDGAVFVAAERGLFVFDYERLVLDAVDRRDGVPSGGPCGVYADPAGRLWLCTPDAFGVVDVRFAFGRTFGPADGLPPGPYEAVMAGADGRIELRTAAGSFAYQPDVGPPPRAAGGEVQRRRLDASAAGEASFAVEVEALGGASLRQRRRHHHLLPPIVDGRLRGLRPGRHTLEVHAVDRDLRRMLVAEYEVHVPLPGAFDPRILPLGAAMLLGLVCLLAWLGGERGQRGRLGATAGRAGVAIVVLLQLLLACLGYGRSWPFVGFSMYTENYHEDSVLYRPRIVAISADGSRRALHEDEVGILQDGYWQMLAEVVHGGDAACRQFLGQLDHGRAPGTPPYAGFQLGDGRIRLTAEGPVDVAPTVLVSYRR